MKTKKEEKKRIKIFEVKDRVYKTCTLFITNCSPEEFVKRAKRYDPKMQDIGDYVCGMVIEDPSGNFFRIVYIQSFDKSPESLGVIAHELFHLVVRICDDKGVPISTRWNCDEAPAYLYEFYMIECTKRLC